MRKEKRCIQCGYEWKPRAKAPRQCPRCKRYDWHQAISEFIKQAEPNHSTSL